MCSFCSMSSSKGIVLKNAKNTSCHEIIMNTNRTYLRDQLHCHFLKNRTASDLQFFYLLSQRSDISSSFVLKWANMKPIALIRNMVWNKQNNQESLTLASSTRSKRAVNWLATFFWASTTLARTLTRCAYKTKLHPLPEKNYKIKFGK